MTAQNKNIFNAQESKATVKTVQLPPSADHGATIETFIHPAEANLLMVLKEIQFGEVQVKVQNGLPVLCTQIIQSRKLI
ncbi:MAG: hypothetical protein WC838_06490 [Candidatus Margulisiibacteriota bacterium]|jgi:hypothetical protein